MLLGYARVSTVDQHLDLQHDALARAGCERVFEDKASGARDDRPGLAAALSHCRQGDVLVVHKLDRLGRTMRGLVQLVADLAQRKIEFRSLSDGIDTTTTMGRFTFHLLGAIAEMERDLIRERTNAGLAAARQGPQGRAQGCPDGESIERIRASCSYNRWHHHALQHGRRPFVVSREVQSAGGCGQCELRTKPHGIMHHALHGAEGCVGEREIRGPPMGRIPRPDVRSR